MEVDPGLATVAAAVIAVGGAAYLRATRSDDAAYRRGRKVDAATIARLDGRILRSEQEAARCRTELEAERQRGRIRDRELDEERARRVLLEKQVAKHQAIFERLKARGIEIEG